jgi:subtilisin family serine protease
VNGPDTNIADFSELYPDQRTPEERAADAKALQPQADRMTRTESAAAYYRMVVQLTQRRRSDRDLIRLALPSRDENIVIVASELLVRRPTDQAALNSLGASLTTLGFVDAGVPPELEELVMRWEDRTNRSADELDDVARSLRAQNFIVSVNHIVPLNPWMKAEGGPEESAGRGILAQGDPVLDWAVCTIDTGVVNAGIRTDGWLDEMGRTGDNVDPLSLPGDPYLGLGAGHGTFVSGVIAQVAQVVQDGRRRPAAPVHMIRALDVDGVGSEVDAAVAMIQAVEAGAKVLNLSLGTQTLDDQPPVAIQAALEVIDGLEGGCEVVIVAAAGNYGDNRPCWPAAFRRVVSVGALTAAGTPAPWSTRGYWVQCSTVGQGVLSTYVPGTESPVVDPTGTPFPDDAWAVWMGTSFAAPQIAGLIARLCAEDSCSPRDALAAILAKGTPLPDFGRAVRILPGT